MAGIRRFLRWVLRRQERLSPVERLRSNDESPVKIQPWEPSETPSELPWEGAAEPGFRVISADSPRRGRSQRKPRGLADDDWHSRPSA